MCHEQWALTVIKRLRFFCINICCFSTRLYTFLYHSGTVNQVSWKLWMFLISTPHKTRTFTVRLAVTTKPMNGFAAEVLLGLHKSRSNRSHRNNSKFGQQWQSCDQILKVGGRSLLENIRNAITRLQMDRLGRNLGDRIPSCSQHDNSGPDNDGPNRRGRKCKTWQWRTKSVGPDGPIIRSIRSASHPWLPWRRRRRGQSRTRGCNDVTRTLI